MNTNDTTKICGRSFYNRTLKRIANKASSTVREVIEFIGADWGEADHAEWVQKSTIREIESWVVAGLR